MVFPPLVFLFFGLCLEARESKVEEPLRVLLVTRVMVEAREGVG